MESSNWANVIHPVDGMDDVVDVNVVIEPGKLPKEATDNVVAVVDVVVVDATPNERETGAALLVAREVPKGIPKKVHLVSSTII